MTTQLTSEQVWAEVEKEIFAVLGMVTAKGEARTVGIVYIVHDRKLFIGTGTDSWKARHVRGNPNVSLTVPITKRVPLMPWMKIPAATITFSGIGRVLGAGKVNPDVLQAIFRGLEKDEEMVASTCVIEVEPRGEFITYGVGIPLLAMRDSEKARGRVSVG
jgi:hypothetical protein